MTEMRSRASTSRTLWVTSATVVPCAAMVRRTAKRESDLARRQDGGRLVEDQHLGLPVQRLEDLDPLAHTQGQRVHPCRRVDGEPEPFGELGDAALGGPAGRTSKTPNSAR